MSPGDARGAISVSRGCAVAKCSAEAAHATSMSQCDCWAAAEKHILPQALVAAAAAHERDRKS